MRPAPGRSARGSGWNKAEKLPPGTPATASTPATPLRMPLREVERHVHPDRPADHDRGLDAECVHHRRQVIRVVCHGDPRLVAWALRPAQTPIVPSDDPIAVHPVDDLRPRLDRSSESVAQHHRHAGAVVGPTREPCPITRDDRAPGHVQSSSHPRRRRADDLRVIVPSHGRLSALVGPSSVPADESAMLTGTTQALWQLASRRGEVGPSVTPTLHRGQGSPRCRPPPASVGSWLYIDRPPFALRECWLARSPGATPCQAPTGGETAPGHISPRHRVRSLLTRRAGGE